MTGEFGPVAFGLGLLLVAGTVAAALLTALTLLVAGVVAAHESAKAVRGWLDEASDARTAEKERAR